MQDQREGQEPGQVEGSQQNNLVVGLGEVGVEEVYGSMLQTGNNRTYFPWARGLRAFGP